MRWARLRAWLVRFSDPLRAACAIVDGRPHVRNLGRMIVGRGVRVSARPVPTSLATGRDGTLVLGRGARIAHGVSIYAHARVELGERGVVGPFAVILDVDFHALEDRAQMGEPRPVTLGRRVRVGAGAVILRGAVVEDGAIIEPGAVVARRVRRGERVAGVPARPRG